MLTTHYCIRSGLKMRIFGKILLFLKRMNIKFDSNNNMMSNHIMNHNKMYTVVLFFIASALILTPLIVSNGALVVGEKKGLVTPDGAAQRPAKLVVAKRILGLTSGIREKIRRIHGVISEKLK